MSLHDILSGEGVRTAIVFIAFAQQWEAHYLEFLWGHWSVFTSFSLGRSLTP